MNGEAGQDSGTSLYAALAERCRSLEAGLASLQQQLDVLLREQSSRSCEESGQEVASDSGDLTSYPGWGYVPGAFFDGSPYKNVLEYMGHAVHVSRPATEEIIYWNRSAEKLYGYKDEEAIGQSAIELLIDREHQEWAASISERLWPGSGKTWSGQLPCKKRSGQRFMAMVTKNPLYEDEELVGVITVSSDAALFNSITLGNLNRSYEAQHNGQAGIRTIYPKRLQWRPRPLIAPSVSEPPKAPAAKVFSKLNIAGMVKLFGKNQTNGCSLASMEVDETCSPETSQAINNGQGETEPEPNRIAKYEIRWEDIRLKEEIGQGSFAIVYRGIWNGSDVAVKVYFGNECSEGTLLDYKKEIDIMKRLRHPNVLLFMGAVSSQEKLALITEYLPRGSLFKTLHKSSQQLDTRRRLRMALDVARGMNYLHCRNPPIVHRDLKSSNLLVDKSWTVKPQWMAPEVLRNEPSTEKSDVFSFGVILWELMTESIPWSDLNSLQVVGVVGFMDRRLDIPGNIDPRVSSIILDCWRSNPEDRPSFHSIIVRVVDVIQACSRKN
ncbi:probable serine/threonine-protein kinase drkA isoform X2 [Ipomoea triloba]|uniref:probable serine/threonine-protein kinase drkA isoform X2 n=1 Tax=Ipomoea triloba TaxID=35885 RepID=UPI00125E884D|nr:probable serine/threonine-protein kinase drkA isoform X2 [Ipomoea triloba]